MHRFLLVPLCLLAALPAASAQRSRPAPVSPGDLPDAYVARVMETFNVPGMAVTIVRGGKVVLARGYGIQRIGDTARVTSETRFGLGKITRAFTATALAILADFGRVPLDSPVVRHLPEFALADPYVTANLTVRDLLLQRSGLGAYAGDLLWWPSTTYGRMDIVRRLRSLPLHTGFRSEYSQENVLYIVAGALIESVTKKTWESFITDTLLRRLDMRHTGVRHSDARLVGNIAAPHTVVNDTLARLRPLDTDVANPNSGMNSSADDMAKWMIAQLRHGRRADSVDVWREYSQVQLWKGMTAMRGVSVRDVDEMRLLGYSRPMLDVLPRFRSYALGAEVKDYRGTQIIAQQGQVPGYASEVIYVPSLDLGITVLTNQYDPEAVQAVTRHVLDQHLGFGNTDWVGMLDQTRKQMRRRLAQLEREMPETRQQLDSVLRDTTSKPTLGIWKYAGQYEDPWYGPVRIDVSSDYKLTLVMGATPGMVGDVTHWEKDVFTVRWRDRSLDADAYIWFSFDRQGRIEGARMTRMPVEGSWYDPYTDLRLRRTSY